MYSIVAYFFFFCLGVFVASLFTTKVIATTQPTNTLTIVSTDAVGRHVQTTGTWQQLAWNGTWQLTTTSDTILCNGFQ